MNAHPNHPLASERIFPNRIEAIGQELAIAWNDGRESYLPLESLRRACPCAVCQGEADVMGHVDRPQPELTPHSFELRGFQTIGGYALQPRWADGHGTGLYSYAYLRTLSDTLSPGGSSV